MGFHRSETDTELSEINITPLVDVMLVLLVAFMVTAPLMSNVVNVNLPQTARTSPPREDKAHTLEVDAVGVYRLDGEVVSEDALEGRLAVLKQAMDSDASEAALHLQADAALNYGKVVNVMAIVERTGIQKLAVFTQPH